MDNLNGLSTEKALELQKQYGKNTLKEEKQKSIARMCLEQICNITNFVLIAAIVISVLLGDYGEACIIGIIIVANTVIGVVQERKAQKTLDALKKISTLKATVIRDGETKEISSEDFDVITSNPLSTIITSICFSVTTATIRASTPFFVWSVIQPVFLFPTHRFLKNISALNAHKHITTSNHFVVYLL